MEMCPRRAQPRWQMRESMVAPAQANTLPIGSRDGPPGMSGDPMGSRHSSVPARPPSHHQVLKTSGRRPGALQPIPEWFHWLCSGSHTPRGTAAPAHPQPPRDKAAPPPGRVPISKSQSPHPQNGQMLSALPDSCWEAPEARPGEGGTGPSADVGLRRRVWLHIWSLK